jgi:hypothetical protein
VRISVPAPALLSEPDPKISASSVNVSVKFATISPRLKMNGVVIEPARPPVPRLSVLPATIRVARELTAPPSATVSVPTSGPQPQSVSPTESAPAFKTEPAPLTVNRELPLAASPMVTRVELTTAPSEIVSLPIPPVLPPPTSSPSPPTFHVDPGPVTVARATPKKESISAPPWLLSTPPLPMVSIPGPNTPIPVKPSTVTLEPAPEMSMLDATKRSALLKPDDGPICSVPPLMTESVPPNTVTPMEEPLTVSAPPSIVSPPLEQLHSVRSPPMVPILRPLLVPVSVSVAPLSSSSEPAPANAPENVVLLFPAMNSVVPGLDVPSRTVPPPADPSASEPIWTEPPSPMASRAPLLTLKAGMNDELLLIVLLIVKVAPFWTRNE